MMVSKNDEIGQTKKPYFNLIEEYKLKSTSIAAINRILYIYRG